MWRYTIKRLIQGVVTVWFIATATFLAMHAVPGDPMSGDRAVTPEIRKNLEAKYGLDKPLAQQYVIYLGNLARGDFGISFTQQNREVNDIIREHGDEILDAANIVLAEADAYCARSVVAA